MPAVPRAMVKRLDEICRREGLSPARSSLVQLVDIVDGDIRAALNTLQFMQRNFGQISSSSIAMAAVGHKDVGKSNFELWKSIFGVSAQVKAASKHGKAVPPALRKAELRELELAIERGAEPRDGEGRARWRAARAPNHARRRGLVYVKFEHD